MRDVALPRAVHVVAGIVLNAVTSWAQNERVEKVLKQASGVLCRPGSFRLRGRGWRQHNRRGLCRAYGAYGTYWAYGAYGTYGTCGAGLFHWRIGDGPVRRLGAPEQCGR